MDWSDSWRGACRLELRAEAIGFAARGWPVLPGTYPANSGWTGEDASSPGPTQDGPAPVRGDRAEYATADDDRVADWWSEEPYTIFLATGSAVEALETNPELGLGVAVELREAGLPVPIVATPDRRWFFLTSPGRRLRRELVERPAVTRHGSGSVVPLPPSPYPTGAVHWRVKPDVCGWMLPESELVQDAILAALYLRSVANRLVAAQK